MGARSGNHLAMMPSMLSPFNVGWSRRPFALRMHSSTGVVSCKAVTSASYLYARFKKGLRWLASKLHRSTTTSLPACRALTSASSQARRLPRVSWHMKTRVSIVQIKHKVVSQMMAKGWTPSCASSAAPSMGAGTPGLPRPSPGFEAAPPRLSFQSQEGRLI